MAKEIIVTSVPRGINLGRTGFQVVMRTAGISDGVMSSLEQLAVYRHVPEKSGRNPVIYSYRLVRGTTGQLHVLGRTVDAGNDFSNRSNKLAHLLSVDPAELSTLRNSSPAAVLAAIEGRLATVWQGGPEERVSPFALPSPPVQPAVCSRWAGVTGDAGWGGVLAQRAMRGQPSLVIAPDCSPAWCRTLLELFQEVYALLPPENRWRTTFDTTVIGSSSSLLRGTYAGSPESAAGHAGLLVVDLSSRVPMPANMATDELVSVARQGPKQAVARGPSRMPSLPPTLEGTAGPMLPVGQTMVGQTTADPHHPPRAPDSWDDDEPKSRLHWYILCGVLLAAIALAGGSVAAWYWWDNVVTKDYQDRIYAYADADGGKPDGPQPELTPDDWRRAFRDDKTFPTNNQFPLLMSAIATQKVGKDQVDSTAGRLKLLAAVQGVLQGKDVLENAEALGADVTQLDDNNAHAALDSLVAGWISSRAEQPKISDFGTLERAIDAATRVVAAAFDEQGGDARQKLGENAVDFLWPKLVPVDKRSDVMKRFRKSLAANKAGLSYKSARDTLNAAVDTEIAAEQEKKKAAEAMTAQESQQDQAQLASNAFTALRKQLAMYRPKPVTELTEGPVTLASKLDPKHLAFFLSMPACGDWKPWVEAPSLPKDGPRTWKLKGLPDDSDKHWGTVTLDTEKNELTFKSELAPDGPQDHLYIPLLVSPKDDLALDLEPFPLTSLAAPEKVVATVSEGESCSLYDVLTGGPVALTTRPPLKVHPSLLIASNLLKMTLNRPGSKDPSDFALETRASNGSQESTTDLFLDIAAGDPAKKTTRRVWIESLSSKCEADEGGIRFLLSRSQSSSLPWTARPTRFDFNSRIGKGFLNKELGKDGPDWNRTEFTYLVKVILDDYELDPASRKKNIVGHLGPRIAKSLSPKEKEVPENDKRKLEDWRERTFNFVTEPKHPFYVFVRTAFEQTNGERPPAPQPPKEPDSKADKQAKEMYEADKNEYQQAKAIFEEKCRKWDADLEKRLDSPLWLTKFLFDGDAKGDADSRDFAVALLGIDAWLALDGCKPETEANFKELSLDSIFEANLELEWRWTPDDKPTRVKRFEVKRPVPKPIRTEPL
jgi:hypothetical protein